MTLHKFIYYIHRVYIHINNSGRGTLSTPLCVVFTTHQGAPCHARWAWHACHFRLSVMGFQSMPPGGASGAALATTAHLSWLLLSPPGDVIVIRHIHGSGLLFGEGYIRAIGLSNRQSSFNSRGGWFKHLCLH